jgi:hypothetical protein
MYSVLNCHAVAKHIEFYLRWLRFNVTFTGDIRCFKNSLVFGERHLNPGEAAQGVVGWVGPRAVAALRRREASLAFVGNRAIRGRDCSRVSDPLMGRYVKWT